MDIFVYGSLTGPQQVGQVVDSFAFLGSAVLVGLHPVQGEYPTLAPGGETGGRLLRTDEIEALDSYEGVDDDDLYVRVSVPLDRADPGDDETVEVYVGDPVRLGVEEPVEWPGTAAEPFANRVERFLRDNAVEVQYRRE